MRTKPARIETSRRTVLFGAAASLAAMPTTSFGNSLGTAATIARGSVFDDQRGDGWRQPGDRGLPGVLVSNGRDVVATDSDGRWFLPVAPGDHIFVVKPPHWSISQEHGGRSGSYLHQPWGSSTAFQFAGVAPTGSMPHAIDFPLRRMPESNRFDVALVADTQPSNLTELGYLRSSLIAPLAAENVAFAINHGDVVGDDLSLFERYLELVSSTGVPWHHCPGNHDMNLDSPDGDHAFETWKRVFGPPHYAFQAGDATFIILNTVEYAGHPRARSDLPAYRGWIGPKQLTFVANLLRHVLAHHLIVVSMHVPLASYEDPDSVSDRVANRSSLLELLSRRPHSVSFAGHLHTTEHHYLGLDAGFTRKQPHHHHVLTAACGSWWSGPPDRTGVPVADSRDGSPKGFHILSIDGNQYETRFVAAAREQMRVLITSPDAIGSGAAGCGRILSSTIAMAATSSAQVVVDVFDGGPNTRVLLVVDGERSAEIELTRTYTPDPHIVEAFSDGGFVRPSWLQACPSSHIWVGGLPKGLAVGRHVLMVRAIGEFGREHVSHTEIVVT
jgi:C terminal of Calcineurin-like phosphoesterase/Calcineurin-like phosphoesterase